MNYGNLRHVILHNYDTSPLCVPLILYNAIQTALSSALTDGWHWFNQQNFSQRLNKWMWQNVHTQNTTWLSFLLIKSIQFFFLKYDTVLCIWRNTPLHDFSSNKTSKTFLSSYFRIIEKSFSVRQLLKGLVAQLVRIIS